MKVNLTKQTMDAATRLESHIHGFWHSLEFRKADPEVLKSLKAIHKKAAALSLALEKAWNEARARRKG